MRATAQHTACTFIQLFGCFRSEVSPASLRRLVVLADWVLTTGRHAVTQAERSIVRPAQALPCFFDMRVDMHMLSLKGVPPRENGCVSS
jgi:hypothetical protein